MSIVPVTPMFWPRNPAREQNPVLSRRRRVERRLVGVVNPIGGAAMRTNPHHRHRRRARRTRRNPDTLFTVLLMAAALVAGVALSRYGVVEQLLPGDLEQRLFPGTT